MVMAHADSPRGRDALRGLDFFVQADLFMTPTAELADIVLPVTTPFESEALKIGFEYSQEAQSLVQLRQPLVAPRGEARSDLQIVFDLATRLGLGAHFWDGDIEAAFRHQLAPSGITLEELRANPAGVRVPLTTRYRKYADTGFTTPSRRSSCTRQRWPTMAMPRCPPSRNRSRALAPDPTSPTGTRWCSAARSRCSSARPSTARSPPCARARPTRRSSCTRHGRGPRHQRGGLGLPGHPARRVRARARFNASLDPEVVFGQHGWWEACDELGLPGYPPFGPDSANLNLVLRQTPSDPISGSSPLRATVCDVSPLEPARDGGAAAQRETRDVGR